MTLSARARAHDARGRRPAHCIMPGAGKRGPRVRGVLQEQDGAEQEYAGKKPKLSRPTHQVLAVRARARVDGAEAACGAAAHSLKAFPQSASVFPAARALLIVQSLEAPARRALPAARPALRPARPCRPARRPRNAQRGRALLAARAAAHTRITAARRGRGGISGRPGIAPTQKVTIQAATPLRRAKPSAA